MTLTRRRREMISYFTSDRHLSLSNPTNEKNKYVFLMLVAICKTPESTQSHPDNIIQIYVTLSSLARHVRRVSRFYFRRWLFRYRKYWCTSVWILSLNLMSAAIKRLAFIFYRRYTQCHGLRFSVAYLSMYDWVYMETRKARARILIINEAFSISCTYFRGGLGSGQE